MAHRSSSRRADVQGLRAVAVAAVLLDHTFAWPTGGFLGVDVFFVVSGFVVGRGLLAEHSRSGRLDLRAFVRRRARRLMPSAVVVIGATMIAVVVLFRGSRRTDALLDGLAGLLGVANWRFVQSGVDYFDAGATLSPFRHLWSLGVEEQFYVLLPLVVLLAGRRRLWLVLLTLIITAGSLALAAVVTTTWSEFAFFSTGTRVWELGAGLLVALGEHRLRRTGSVAATSMSCIGAVLVILAVLFGRPDDEVRFAAMAAATAGTALLVAAGARSGTKAGHRNVVAASLGCRWLGAVGSRSYALYLWHWPALVILPTAFGTPPVVALIVAAAAAVVSTTFIEEPFRRRVRPAPGPHTARTRAISTRHVVAGVTAVSAAVVLTTTAAVSRYVDDGSAEHRAAAVPFGPQDAPAAESPRTALVRAGLALSAWPDDLQPARDAILGHDYLGSLQEDDRFSAVFACGRPTQPHTVGACTMGNGAKTLMVVGDSAAEFMTPAFQRIVDRLGPEWQFVAGARYGCPFTVLDIEHGNTDCTEARAEVDRHIAEAQPDVLIVMNVLGPLNVDGTQLSEHDRAEGVEGRIERVRGDVGTVAVVTPNVPGPSWDDCGSAVRGPSQCTGSTARWRPSIAADRAAARRHDHAHVDSTPLWCSDGQCPTIIGGHPVTFDGTHATYDAADDVGEDLDALLVESGVLPEGRPPG